MVTLKDIYYCAEECEKQHSGEMSVYRMVHALEYARAHTTSTTRCKLSKSFIKEIGKIIEPMKNQNGFRQIPVFFGGYNTAIKAEHIERAIDNLLECQKNMQSIEFFREFETIHPFIDGNGRVGSILFNMVNGTIHCPIEAPKVF